MATSQKELQQAKQIGASGGSVDTTGRSSQDKQALDKARNDGKAGK